MRAMAAMLLLVSPVMGVSAASAQERPATGDSEAARIKLASDLLDLSGYERQLDFMFARLAPVFSQAVIGGMQGDPAAKGAVDELIAKGKGGQARLVAIFSDEFLKAIKAQYPQMKERAAKEYAAAFTKDELESIADFYRTPAGAKSLLVLPELQAKLSKVGEESGRIAGSQAGRAGFERAVREMLPESGNNKL